MLILHVEVMFGGAVAAGRVAVFGGGRQIVLRGGVAVLLEEGGHGGLGRWRLLWRAVRYPAHLAPQHALLAGGWREAPGLPAGSLLGWVLRLDRAGLAGDQLLPVGLQRQPLAHVPLGRGTGLLHGTGHPGLPLEGHGGDGTDHAHVEAQAAGIQEAVGLTGHGEPRLHAAHGQNGGVLARQLT